MNIDVHELKGKMERGEDFLLLDVRTPHEHHIASVPGATLIPMQELSADTPELQPWREKEIVCMCHHGGRSARVQQYLLSNGFTNVQNLLGGIHAYAEEIDSSIPTYE